MSCLTWSYASTLLLRRCTGRSTSPIGNDTTILLGCVGFFSPDASCKTPIFSLSTKFTPTPQVSPYSLLLLPLIAPTDSMVCSWSTETWRIEILGTSHCAPTFTARDDNIKCRCAVRLIRPCLHPCSTATAAEYPSTLPEFYQGSLQYLARYQWIPLMLPMSVCKRWKFAINMNGITVVTLSRCEWETFSTSGALTYSQS